MNPSAKNALAVVAGVVLGGLVNIGIILISGSIIPPPEGVDTTTQAGLKAGMHLMQPKHFIMPFLAHALGTFGGAFIAAKFAATHKMSFAIGIGAFFLMGGVASIATLPSPTWFSIVDLVGAYLPMAWIAGKISSKTSEH